MKLTSIFFLALCLQVKAIGFSQNVTVSVDNVPLKNVFNQIENQTGYHFYYKVELIKEFKNISLRIYNKPLESALKEIFRSYPLQYNIVEKNIIVRSKSIEKQNLSLTQEEMPIAIDISGTVTDEQDGRPLKGASIIIKGTKTGTSTNEKGYFELKNITQNATLIVSYSGYQNKEIVVVKSQNLSVKLQKTISEIDEIIVNMGIYSRPKENFTGSATTITGDELRNVNSLNMLQALKVFDPAVRIPDNIQFGSDPNRLPDISIRGTNNFPVQGDNIDLPSSGSDFMAAYQSNPSIPLFILDGFEVSLQKVYDLDINRIDKMTILKDAVATAAYGSRAANGVIVIDTKQPDAGKLTVNYSTTLQITGPDLTSYHLLDAREKLELEKVGGLFYSTNPAYQLFYDKIYSKRKADIERGVNTYWMAQPLQKGIGNKHSLFVEGGDEYIRYGANFGYNYNKGVMKGSSRRNYEGGMMLSYRKKNFLVRNQLSLTSNRADNSAYGSFADYVKLNPYWSPFNEDGRVRKVLDIFQNPGIAGQTRVANPLYNATLGTEDYSKYFGIRNNTFLEWKVKKSLKLTAKIGITSQSDQADNFLPADHTAFVNITNYNSTEYFTRGSYSKQHASFFSYDLGLTGDYNKRIGRSLFFATLGFAAAEQNSRGSKVTVRGFPNNRLDEFFFGKEYLRNSKPSGYNNLTRRVSMFTSLNYTYDSRYLVDFSWNTDGSTQFGVDHRFAPFWAVGLGWNLHEESFLSGLKGGVINRLKLRAGIGTTGSQQFSPYMAVSTYEYNTSQDYLGMFGASLLSYGNPSLKWQQTEKRNIGADIALLDNRIIIRMDAYKEVTNDLLLDVNTPPSLGVSSYKENVGKLSNVGFEGNLNVFIIKNEKRSTFWSAFVNLIHNRNRIQEISNSLKKLNEKNDEIDGNSQTSPKLRFVEGQSVNAIWAVRSAGIDPSNGKEVFYTKEGELTYTWNAADKVIVGDAIPDLGGNLGTNFSYAGFQLGLYFSYQLGGTLYNQTLADRIENANIRYNVDERVLMGRWKEPGDVTFFKGLVDVEGRTVTSVTNATSRFLQKNDFLELESISLGYILPDKLLSEWDVKNTRINFQINNLFRISTIQVERGLIYPFARNFSVNLSTSF